MDSNLIPRKILFGNPNRASVRISPDGKKLAYLAADDGVMNVWVAEIGDPENGSVVTQDRSTGISQFFWAYTCRHILYLQDKDGDEDFHLYCVDLETNQVIDLTPFESITAQVNHISHRFPEEILVGINDRDQHWFHDIYRINVVSGDRTLIEKNDGFIGFTADEDLQLKLAFSLTPTSDLILLKKDEREPKKWQEFLTVNSTEVMTTSPISLDKTGELIFMLDSRNRDKAAITSIDMKTGQEELIFESDKADVDGVLTHPTECTIQAVNFTFDRAEYAILDKDLESDFQFLSTVCDGEMEIANRTLDQNGWIVSYTTDDGPIRYYIYDAELRQADFLFSHRPELDELKLAKMQSITIKSRDELDLVSYLSLPPDSGESTGRLPMVLLVHGGPWARDFWGFNPLHQLLANRGYAVLSVNYRGSTGLGKGFINAANHEWAGKMHDDLIDAVNWAVENGIADPDKIAIMGGSYGGYAALVGLSMTPEVFCCGIDIVGPSNLITLMENPPPYWMPIMPLMTTRVGDSNTDDGRTFLESRSPLFHADKICHPLLIGQGANDPRVKQAESDQIVKAMSDKNIPVTYVLYPDEGHGFDRPENDISFYAICEAFLAEHLGGRAEPVGDDFVGANFEIRAGVDQIAGLETTVKS